MFYQKLLLNTLLSLGLLSACQTSSKDNNNQEANKTTEQPSDKSPAATETPKIAEAAWITQLKSKQNCSNKDLKALIENENCTAETCEGNWDDLPNNDMTASMSLCAEFGGLVQLGQWHLVSISTQGFRASSMTKLYVLGQGGKQIKQELTIKGMSNGSGGRDGMIHMESETQSKVDEQGHLIILEKYTEEDLNTGKSKTKKTEERYRFDATKGMFEKI